MSYTETQERVEDIVGRYKTMVLAQHQDNPTAQEAFARDLLNLTAGFRPDCREALHAVFVELFFHPHARLPPTQPRERPRGCLVDPTFRKPTVPSHRHAA